MRQRAPIEHVPGMAVVKVAARCNLYCTYCHWFRDATVESRPAVMSQEVEQAMFSRFREYILGYGLHEFVLCLHGGEPLVFGKERIRGFVASARRLAWETGARIDVCTTTNGVLVDAAMADLLRDLDIQVCVSMDGPREIHDRARVDRRGRGSFDKVVGGIKTLRGAGIEPTLLSVIDPHADPVEILKCFVDELGFQIVDFLLPDVNREDAAAGHWKSVSPFLISLFDAWYDDYSRRGVRIRLLEAMIASVLGRRTGLQGVGFSPMCVLCINSDGGLENHDALRISGVESIATDLNVMTSPIDALFSNPVWRAPYEASLRIPEECEECSLRPLCRGGDVIHRYEAGHYDRRSPYCSDYLDIYPHIAARIRADLKPRTRRASSITPWRLHP